MPSPPVSSVFFLNRQREKKKAFQANEDLILKENIRAYIYSLRIGKNIFKSDPLPKMGVMLNFCIVSDRKWTRVKYQLAGFFSSPFWNLDY